jgi:hypothetical protein
MRCHCNRSNRDGQRQRISKRRPMLLTKRTISPFVSETATTHTGHSRGSNTGSSAGKTGFERSGEVRLFVSCRRGCTSPQTIHFTVRGCQARQAWRPGLAQRQASAASMPRSPVLPSRRHLRRASLSRCGRRCHWVGDGQRCVRQEAGRHPGLSMAQHTMFSCPTNSLCQDPAPISLWLWLRGGSAFDRCDAECVPYCVPTFRSAVLYKIW